jgi:uncharacterized protein (TIGR03437 family)
MTKTACGLFLFLGVCVGQSFTINTVAGGGNPSTGNGDGGQPSIRSANGVVTASAFGGFSTIAPGTWIEIYGSNLATNTRSWGSADFNGTTAPTTLDGTQVSVGGESAFVAYISPGQVNPQVPSNVAIGPQSVVVTTAAGQSSGYSVNVAAAEPGLLAPSSFSVNGQQYVVAQFTDGSYVLPPGAIAGVNSRRAFPGDTITIYGVGFGAVAPIIAAGQVVQQANALTGSFQIKFGSTVASATYDGLAPNVVGLYQFNVVVPSIPLSDAVPVTFSLNGVAGTQTLYTSVQNGAGGNDPEPDARSIDGTGRRHRGGNRDVVSGRAGGGSGISAVIKLALSNGAGDCNRSCRRDISNFHSLRTGSGRARDGHDHGDVSGKLGDGDVDGTRLSLDT